VTPAQCGQDLLDEANTVDAADPGDVLHYDEARTQTGCKPIDVPVEKILRIAGVAGTSSRVSLARGASEYSIRFSHAGAKPSNLGRSELRNVTLNYRSAGMVSSIRLCGIAVVLDCERHAPSG